MVEALRRCTERLTTALLTNNFVGLHDGPDGRPIDPGIAEVRRMFDVVIESSKVGVRKPDPRFYEIACDGARRRPARGGVPRRPRREPQAGPRPWACTTIKVDDPAVALAELEAVVGFPLG